LWRADAFMKGRGMKEETLYHRVEGAGEPVLLLNGVAMSVNSWQPIAAPLARDHRVIRCDLRGQLMSPGAPHPDVGGHVDDVVALLDELDLETVHLIGTSYGGVVAALLAARRPERVRSLISVASADGFDDVMAVEVARWREACLLSLDGQDKGLISDVFERTVYSQGYLAAHREDRVERRRQITQLPEEWFRGLAALLDTAPHIKITDELGNVRCPTLVIAAQEDGFIPLDRTRVLATRIPNARFLVMEGAGHAVVVEQPENFVEIIRGFLQGV
jgi:3-oxoadipate enol-lactonase